MPAVSKPRLVFLVGPTASGKTGAGILLARKLRAEIISCDSMQVYKGMRILSSQPDPVQRRAVRHHLVGFLAPSRRFDAAKYRAAAMDKIGKLQKQGRSVLFVGGTGLYMSALLDGIFPAKGDKACRARLEKEAREQGSGQMHARLLMVDPEAAAKIHPNDAKRIVRALEVYEATGMQISALQKQRSGIAGEFEVRVFGLLLEKELLHRRIDERVKRMVKQGLVPEVRRLLRVRLSQTAQFAIGIREIKEYLRDKITLDEALAQIGRNTKAYAKRQMTWFKKDSRVQWVGVAKRDTAATVAARIYRLLWENK
jgi:tRNA dimethylallyltransferase